LLDVVEVAEASGRAVEEIAATWYELSHRYGIEGMLDGIAALPRADRWQSLARAALRDDLYSALRDLTAAVVAHAGAGDELDPAAAVEAWENAHAPAVRRARQTMGDLEGEPGAGDLAALSVGLRTLRTVLRAG
jgi:glutamate dehydrogenase